MNNEEMARVLHEARGRSVLVNGWQEGAGNLPVFPLVTDQTSRTTFGVAPGEPLAAALGKARARMAKGRRGGKPESA
jgi:hypothetical protein